MERPPKYLSEFGPFRLDHVNRLLTRDGEIVSLAPKVFDTLLVLVEQAGQVLSKSELMERIWPDVAVEENNLTQHISALRKILGKDSSGQDYIKTIPKRGYCFTSTVQEVWEEGADFILEKSSRSRIVVEEEQDASSPPGEDVEGSVKAGLLSPAPVSEPRRFRWSRTWTLTAISSFVVGAIITGAGWLLYSHLTDSDDAEFPSSLPTTYIDNWKSAPRETGSRNGAFSPGGKMIVFCSNRNDHSGIWIKQVAGGESFEIIGDIWLNESPIWSPDEQQIAFVSDRGGAPAIWTVPTFGGTPTLRSRPQKGWPDLKRWSNDSTIYYELDGNLFTLDLTSKEAVQVTHFDTTKRSPLNFSLSPEGDRIAYADGSNEHRDIWVMSLQGGEPIQVTDDTADDRRPVWRPQGKGIVYSSSRNGTYQICIAYMNSHRTAQVTNKDTDNYVSDISPDGSKILFVESREEADLYEVEADTGEEVALTSDLGLEVWPDASADGKTIAFQAASAEVNMFSCSIMSKSVESSGRQLKLAANGFDPRWSPDGSTLGFLRFEKDVYNIWTVKATGGEQRQLTTGDMFFSGMSGLPYERRQARDYSWSPDGSRIAYCSMKSGHANVWVIAIDTMSDERKTDHADPNVELYCPTWSRDGKRIAYVVKSTVPAANGKKVQSVWVTEAGTSRALFSSDTPLRLVGWSETDRDVIVAVVNDSPQKYPAIDLFQVSGDGGANPKIASFASAYLNSIQLSRYAQSIAFVARQDERDNIWVAPASGGDAIKITKNTDPRVYFSGLVWSPDGRAIYCSKLSSRSFISMIDNSRRKDLVSWQRSPNQKAQ